MIENSHRTEVILNYKQVAENKRIYSNISSKYIHAYRNLFFKYEN